MSAGNRKNPQSLPVYKETKRPSAAIYLGCLAMLVIIGVLLGAGFSKASAAEPSIKAIEGTKATGFTVTYWNKTVETLPPIKTSLAKADTKVERLGIREEYATYVFFRNFISQMEG